MNRRKFLATSLATGAAAGLAATASPPAAAAESYRYQGGTSPWPLCLNASTIRPAHVREKVRAAAAAGYDALELWMRDLEQWREEGKKLTELRHIIADSGLFVVDVIGLWDCMPLGEAEYRKSLDLTKHRMEMAGEVGSRHVAVLPLPDRAPFDLHYATEKYRELLELGLTQFHVHPAMEFVSVFKGLRRLGECVAIAIDSNHPQARIIADTFHLYNGGSGFEGLRHISGDLIASFHWTDVAAGKPPGTLRDADRILPGEGVLPLVESLKILLETGYRGPLSLELFRREDWEMDPTEAAKLGIDALRNNVDAALSA